MDIAAWLRELGLERYEQAFRENEIDPKIPLKLTADDLKDIGVTTVGHRRRLLEAIAALAEPASAPQAGPSTPATAPQVRSAEAERRQLTMMFVDLVGSTELSAKLDPEDLRDVMRAYQAACVNVVGRFEGHVARFLATASWRTSAGRARTKTTPSARCAPGFSWSGKWPSSSRAPGWRCRRALGSQPATSWSAT